MAEKKILVTYYSRTGTTKKVAEELAEKLNCDIEEIIDENIRTGLWGYMKSGYQAFMRILPKIEIVKMKPIGYDLVIICGPTWAGTLSCPIRSYLKLYSEDFKSVAVLKIKGGSKSKGFLRSFKNITQKEPVAILELKRKEIEEKTFTESLNKFVEEIKQSRI